MWITSADMTGQRGAVSWTAPTVAWRDAARRDPAHQVVVVATRTDVDHRDAALNEQPAIMNPRSSRSRLACGPPKTGARAGRTSRGTLIAGCDRFPIVASRVARGNRTPGLPWIPA
jgi:hypothetical protein